MGKSEDRLALVTGASRGIGYHSALTLARAGLHVIAVARTVGGLEELDDEIREAGGSATLVPMDLLDFEAIDRLGASIHERWGKLDVLVSNAAMLGGLSPLEHIEPKTFEKVINLNVTANWRLLCSMSPLLRAAPAARAIFMTAYSAHPRKPFWGAYATSQAALHALVETWAAECEKTPLRINMLNPGPMRTALRAQAFPGETPDTLPHPSKISDSILLLSNPDTLENGKLFDVAQGQFTG
ncbi:MAG: SDR family NAD(P)-dependent oxidoreductase [Rhizobiaceae bacterium]